MANTGRKSQYIIQGSSCWITLQNEAVAVIDTDVLPYVQYPTWTLQKTSWRHLRYVVRHERKGGRKGKLVRYHLHREIWKAVKGDIPPDMVIDHINGDTLDNRISNLRLADNALNTHNSYKHRNGLTTNKLQGVHWHPPCAKWIAQINIVGKKHHLGLFSTEIEGHRAYMQTKNTYERFGILPLKLKKAG